MFKKVKSIYFELRDQLPEESSTELLDYSKRFIDTYEKDFGYSDNGKDVSNNDVSLQTLDEIFKNNSYEVFKTERSNTAGYFDSQDKVEFYNFQSFQQICNEACLWKTNLHGH